MKKLLLMSATAILLSSPALASDTDMTCSEISSELETLQQTIDAASSAETTDNVVGAGAAVATQGAIMSGVGGSVPIVGGLFNMGKSVSDMNKRNTAAAAEKAEKRIIKLETIADMKGC